MPRKLEHADLKVKQVALTAIKPHPANARVHNSREQVAESLEVHGLYKPLLIQKGTGYILAGNGTWELLIEAGEQKASVIELDVDDDQAKRILLVDNRTSDTSTYNELALGELLATFEDEWEGTGWTEDSAENLLKLIGGASSAAELIGAHGEDYDPDDPANWPRISIPLSPDLYGPWQDHASDFEDNTAALGNLMQTAGLLEQEAS
jgi:ParB-like nuclease domain